MKLGAVTIGIAMIAGVAYAWMPDSSEQMPASSASWDTKAEYWKKEIARSGGESAYALLATAIHDAPYGVQHTWAHVFGSALFAIEGADSIGICDERFSFGCSHQFLSDAITSLGLESIVQLNEACFETGKKSPLSCQHGMGHGILAEIGYEFSDLEKALDTCRTLPGTDSIGGCYGGVFMEYNVRTMLLEAATPRTFTGNIIEPCDAVDDAYRTACFYWQPQWWLQAPLHNKSPQEQYKTMGGYCRQFALIATLKRACFEGLGNVVPQSSEFDIAQARALCDVAGTTGAERLLCRAVAANHFGIDVSDEAGKEICEGLNGEPARYCLLSARNAITPKIEFPLPIL